MSRAGYTHTLPNGVSVHLWPSGTYSVDFPDGSYWFMDRLDRPAWRIKNMRPRGKRGPVESRDVKADALVSATIATIIRKAQPHMPSLEEVRLREEQNEAEFVGLAEPWPRRSRAPFRLDGQWGSSQLVPSQGKE